MRRFWIAFLLLAAGLCLVLPSSLAGRSLEPMPSAPATDADGAATVQPEPAAADTSAHNSPAPARRSLSDELPERRPPAPASTGPRDLIGGNFPISNFADSVTGVSDVHQPASAYDPQRGQYLTVWRGACPPKKLSPTATTFRWPASA